jgi:hypothetical protein
MPAPLAKSRSRLDLYDRDYFAWTVEQARVLRTLQPVDLDWENVAEEIESLGRSDKQRIASNLNVVLLHLLKWKYQPVERSLSWRGSIVEHRDRVNDLLADSPSLRHYPGDVLAREHVSARLKAIGETGLPERAIPAACPFTIEQVLDPGFWPNDAQ